VRGNLASGAAVFDPFGAVVPNEIRTKVLAVKDEITAAKKVVWTGPIVKQDGTQAAAPDEKLALQAVETMDYLVKGVIGSAK
jgi:basic membrane protein A